MSGEAYRQAGVNIDAQDRALSKVKKLARSTFTRGVLSDLGSFGGLFRPELKGLKDPVLVASADGVGTKLLVAKMAGDYSSVGRDLVNHCVDDILVQGAEPLFFMDYVGTGVLEPEAMVQLIEGVAEGCRENGCALLGGETAEMPGFYQPGDYELVGFIVGLLDGSRVLGADRVKVGDILVGLPSSGLHTNGYSLARKVFFEIMGLDIHQKVEDLPGSPALSEVLLAPHRTYLPLLKGLLDRTELHAMAHITGGGLTDNVPRVLPKKTHAQISVGTWEIPPLYHLLQERGEVSTEEMFRVFNMGIGMVLVVDPSGVKEVVAHLRKLKESPFIMGAVHKGAKGVVYDLERRLVEE